MRFTFRFMFGNILMKFKTIIIGMFLSFIIMGLMGLPQTSLAETKPVKKTTQDKSAIIKPDTIKSSKIEPSKIESIKIKPDKIKSNNIKPSKIEPIKIKPTTIKSTVTKPVTKPAATKPIDLTQEKNDNRSHFLQAETAFAQGKTELYQKLKIKLADYPLYPYLIFAEYDRKMHSLTLDEFQQFMKNYPDTPLADQLRQRWLHTKAKQEDWQGFLTAYVPTEDTTLQCHFYWAELQNQKNKNAVLEQIEPLWLRGTEPPKACEAIFKVWEKTPLMTRPLVWQRIKLAIQKGNERLARYMTRYIKMSEAPLVELWIKVHKNPHLVKQKQYFNANHPAILEMIVHGVCEIAKTKPEVAKQIWQVIGKQYPFEVRHWGLVVRAIGLTFAKQRNPEAEKWLIKVPNIYANTEVHEWRIRVALAREDWNTVLHWYKQLPAALAENEAWSYWHARALEKVNRIKESQEAFSKIAQTRSYYGFLASQHMQKPYAIAHQKFELDNSTMAQISRKRAVLRARELYLMNREAKARAEWLTSTQKMTDKERHAAAALALRWDLPNWSILALSKANNKNDLELRFPLVHTQSIIQAAKRHQVDPAFIFAVTRQESCFVSDARNPSSGAMGLMQLMPATARFIAEKHDMPRPGHSALLEPSTNIHFGTKYLRMMLDQHENHPIMAAAAYNAGPGRVKKWRPSFDMSPDAWVETIPFKETRDYVKNVMTYTVIYQQLLGSKPRHVISLKHIPKHEAGDVLQATRATGTEPEQESSNKLQASSQEKEEKQDKEIRHAKAPKRKKPKSGRIG